MKAREKISRADSFPGSSWDFGMRRRTLRCQTSINCLNANEAGHCTDTARTKGHNDVIPSEARDVARAVRALLLLSEKQALSVGLEEQARACNARDSK